MREKSWVSELIRCGLTAISPKLNTKVLYYTRFHKRLDLEHPRTLNEKILWLKLNTYESDPLVKQCADKYRVREYLREKGLSQLLTPLIGVYDEIEEIPWDALPEQFVLKLNVGCGCNLVVRDKSSLDIEAAKRTMRRWMKSQFWMHASELQYKNVKRCILIEEFLGDEDGSLPIDYKFYCMNGKSNYVLVCMDRDAETGLKLYFFDRNWTMLPITQEGIDEKDRIIPKPENLALAFEYAEQLSKDFSYVRVDFYIQKGKIYFGELTFTPAAGMSLYVLPEQDQRLGDELLLP